MNILFVKCLQKQSKKSLSNKWDKDTILEISDSFYLKRKPRVFENIQEMRKKKCVKQ